MKGRLITSDPWNQQFMVELEVFFRLVNQRVVN